MFSDAETAKFINDNFEPVWQSVRAVPTVRIDFGNGNIITRTLHGNIATYVCTAAGQIVDVLPGIYNPAAYRQALGRMRVVADSAGRAEPASRELLLAKYHRNQSKILSRDNYKSAGVEDSLTSASVSAEELAAWQALAGDTRVNETIRRRQIHDKLATAGAVSPDRITKWLYREVLHADLDDPYLGLSKVLFSSYPFKNEDRIN